MNSRWRLGVSSAIPVVSSSSPPDSQGVGSASSEMCTQRTGVSRFVSPGDDPDVEVAENVADGQHSSARLSAAMRREASSRTGRRAASISSNCSGPAISGGENWITGSPRSSERQIRPRWNSSGLR